MMSWYLSLAEDSNPWKERATALSQLQNVNATLRLCYEFRLMRRNSRIPQPTDCPGGALGADAVRG